MGKISLKAILFSLFITSLLSLSPFPAQAQTINYQGYLTDSSGNPVDKPSGIDMRFSLWDSAAGGTELWNEVQNVIVTQGVYSVALGSVTAFPPSLDFTNIYYLQVEIDDGAGGWEVFSDRQELTHVPYAINADTVDGKHASDLDQASHLTDTNNPHNVTAAQVGADPAGSAAAVQNNLDIHAADPSAHHSRYSDAEAVSAVKAADGAGSGLDADLLDGQDSSAFGSAADIAALQTTVADLQALIADLQNQIAALQNKLQYVTVNGTDMIISGANLHIVNGLGSTATINGLGNLIVGYNELRGSGDDRTGSHNIVAGSRHNYSSYGGLIVGTGNTISSPYSSVSGGTGNTASGDYSSVSGGRNNDASGVESAVSGGFSNIASGTRSAVSGGESNLSNGQASSVTGGISNEASGLYASVSGGSNNTAVGEAAWAGGGGGNMASNDYSAVSGGSDNTADGFLSVVCGGINNTAFADYSSVLGGYSNLTGDGSCSLNSVSLLYECTPGTDKTIGWYSTITGGSGNKATGNYASVSGGSVNTAAGSYTSVSGGSGNIAMGESSSISGGENNSASGNHSSISGGGLQHSRCKLFFCFRRLLQCCRKRILLLEHYCPAI
jgi:hypothetical protein